MKASRATATHEAGHAVAAAILQLPLFYANVTAAADRDGETKLTGRAGSHPADLAVYVLAGPVAEKKFSGRATWPASGSEDLRLAEMLVRHRPDFDLALTRAEALVLLNWRPILHVADALQREGELVASRIRQLMMEAT